MRSGAMRHIVDIQSPGQTQNATGEITPAWETPATFRSGVRAAIEPLRAREKFAAAQIQADTDTLIRIRFIEGINEKMRVKHTANSITTYYEIQGVIPVKEMRHEINLLCVKRGAEGFRSG